VAKTPTENQPIRSHVPAMFVSMTFPHPSLKAVQSANNYAALAANSAKPRCWPKRNWTINSL